MTSSQRSLGAGVVIVAACLWGSTGTLQALLPEGRDPFVVAALRLAFGAAYAAYSLATSRIGGRAPPATIASATFLVAALVASPALVLAPTGWLSGTAAWLTLAALGVGATGVSYALYTWGLTRVAASTAVTLALAEPVTAWLLAVFVVGEEMTARTVTGALLILAGLAFVAIFPARAPDGRENI